MAEKKRTTKNSNETKKKQNIEEIFTTSPSQKTKKSNKETKKSEKKEKTTKTKKVVKKESDKITVNKKNKQQVPVTEKIVTELKKDTVTTSQLRIAIIVMLIILIFALVLINSRIHRIEQMIKPTEPITHYVNPKTIFFGDSITDRYDLNKYFENNSYINKGVGGNKTTDLLNRMKESIYDYNPERVILLIGTNDLNAGVPIDEIASNISLIIKKIQKNNSQTDILVESVLPVNSDESADERIDENLVGSRTNHDIKKLNEKIHLICEKTGVTYIDAYDDFTDSKGNLKVEYTTEGLHLTNEGYQKQTEILTKAIQNSIARLKK